MVSILSLFDGLTAAGIIVSCILFGFISLYEAKKYKIRLLAIAAITMFFTGIMWLGPFIDLSSILITGKNLNPIYLYGILSYVWVGPGGIFAMYLGSEIVFPEKKWYITNFFVILGIIFEFFIFFDTINVFIFTLNNPGEDLIDASFNRANICFYIITFYLVSVFILLGIGFLIKAYQSEGIVRKKNIYLSTGYMVFVFCAAVDALLSPGPALFVARLIMMTFAFWMYLGLREAPEQKEKLKPQKEISVKGELFRIARVRPEEITEEQITFYKEQKICLVCKGKALRYIYVCPKCDVLYCEHCARTLEDLENSCWYCGMPFNESKPIRPYKEEKTEDLEIIGKSSKKVSSNKT